VSGQNRGKGQGENPNDCLYRIGQAPDGVINDSINAFRAWWARRLNESLFSVLCLHLKNAYSLIRFE